MKFLKFILYLFLFILAVYCLVLLLWFCPSVAFVIVVALAVVGLIHLNDLRRQDA